MRWSKALLAFSLLAGSAFAEAPQKPTAAYSADLVVVAGGTTTRNRVASDGVHVRTTSADGKSGAFLDQDKQIQWVYGPSFGCVQTPMKPAGYTVTSRDEIIGKETVDGHPAHEVKVTATVSDGKKTTTTTVFEWRATDLGELVLRRKAETNGFESHLEHLVVGKPDAALLAFPSPPCSAPEPVEATRDLPLAAGGFRTIRFSDASCGQLVALPLSLSIPSDYGIRSGAPMGCFWGVSKDLARVLAKPRESDFTGIERGVFWCRVSASTGYDPEQRSFVGDQGPESKWAASMASIGAKEVSVKPAMIGDIPSVRVTARVNGERVYMLYLAVPSTDSPAILINYHPAGKGTADDDVIWQHFVESLSRTKK